MDYMTLKEASEKWGVTPRRSIICVPVGVSQVLEDGYHLADSQGCGETGRPSFQNTKK